MSSLNEAFIKAYGREATSVSTQSAPPPAAAPQTPPSQTLENWYTANAWYRVETAAVGHAAPHVPFTPTYQPPSASELSHLAVPSEGDYRLSPALAVPSPELVVDEEFVPFVRNETAAAVAPVVAPSAPKPTKAPTPPLVAPDLNQLFSPMQVVTGWESSLTTSPPITTVGHVPVVAAAAPKPAPQVQAAPPKPVEVPAKTVAVEKPLPPVQAPRLDAATTAPVPKPHTSFAPPKASAPAPTSTASVAKVAEPAPKPAPVAAPAPSPLGLVQPAWEVDRFQWPDHCKQLLSTENEYLADVGQRLTNAARDGLNILAITSTRRGEGRTTLALCLARAAAKAGVKVALVDADVENPQLVNELGVEAACGWHEVVLNKQPLAEAAIVSLEDKFAFFPWTDSSGLKSLNDPRATRVLRDIAKAYSLVILDLGPVPGRETRLFEDGDACPVDAAILVRDVRWTSAIEAQRVAAQLTAAGIESVGIAENFGPRAQQAA